MAVDYLATRLWLMDRSPDPDPATTDGIGLLVNGTVLYQQSSLGVLTPIGLAPTGLINGGTSGTNLVAAVAQANAAGGGYTIEIGKGTYSLSASDLISLDASGISIIGNGEGSTFLLVADAVDNITINSVLDCRILGLTIISAAPRTSGVSVKVKGANHITATPAERTRQLTMEDVHFEDQFDCFSAIDGPASVGAWGCYLNRVEMIRTAAGGYGIDLNTPHGGQQFYSNMKIYGSSTGASNTRAAAGVRVRGCNDASFYNINTIYTQKGLLVDPPTGQNVNVMHAVACEWDSPSVLPVDIAPASGGSVNLAEFWGNWFGVDAGIASIDSCHVSGSVHGVTFHGGKFISPTGGLKIDGTGGATDVNVIGALFTGGAFGFWATGSLADFRCQNNSMVGIGVLGTSAPSTGVLIDAGCDHYSVTGNNLRNSSTPITNTPGTSAGRRIVQDNIIA